MNLLNYLGRQFIGVLAAYQENNTVIFICLVYPLGNNNLRLYFPKGHSFSVGDLATIHLDNRTGVDEFDADIRVYRASYKGRVIQSEEGWVVLEPRECILFHGLKSVIQIKADDYSFPVDTRPENALLPTSLSTLPAVEERDHPNKVGVLVTLAEDQPHTTVLAFLSTQEDDIFLITFPETFKSKLLKRDSHCFFVMDERASYSFERAIEWNYTIVEGQARMIPPNTSLFESVRNAFIAKNPWEIAFFIRKDLEMYHIKKDSLVCPGALRRSDVIHPSSTVRR